MLEAETRYLATKIWWASFNCIFEEGLKHLQLWLAFWHFRYRQWGGFMELVHLYCYCFLFFVLSSFSTFAYFLHNHSILQEKIMISEEFAQISNCNLAKSIHNKWLQASGNKSGDLYVAAVDDYIQAFLQVVAYHLFFKGGVRGNGPSKKEFKLRCV
jgi:hypothetical protein